MYIMATCQKEKRCRALITKGNIERKETTNDNNTDYRYDFTFFFHINTNIQSSCNIKYFTTTMYTKTVKNAYLF